MIRVLLVSPLDPKKPGNLKFLVGGENTFTRTLLANPAKGVVYMHHLEALKKGHIEYLPLQKNLALLVRARVLPLSSGTQCFLIKKHFDLIHCHGYSLKIEGKSLPVILSDSSSNYLFLRDYVNWPEWRIRIGYLLRRWLFGLLGVVDADTNPNGAKKIIVFSKFAHKLHKDLGVPKEKLEVIYAGLPHSYSSSEGAYATESRSKKESSRQARTINILFVGTWFERKGGALLIEAFKILSEKYSNIRLTIVGQVPKNFKVQNKKLKVYDFVPRERLMREFFPRADIFVLAPPKVEGFGFSVLEAISFGIPVVVSNVCALPELVENGKTGFVVKPGSVNDLVEKLEILIKDQTLREKMGDAARKRFLEKFSIEKSNSGLLKIYNNALKSS